VKDGDFDRLRIPVGNGSDGPTLDDGASDALGGDDMALGAERPGVGPAPAQLAVGSAILAGLILLGVAAVRRRRGRRPPATDV